MILMSMENTAARRFVSACLEMQWNVLAEERARQLAAANIDWDAVRQFAEAEELAPFLYHWVRGKDLVPALLEQHLAAAYHTTAAQNTLQLNDLAHVLDLLAAEGVAVVVLKGAALIEGLYRNAAVRPMEDVDLLVRPEALPRAIKILSDVCGVPALSPNQIGALVEREREMVFSKPGAPPIIFDLHWQALDSPYQPHARFTDWLWKNGQPFQLGNRAALMLDRQALVLHLCGHRVIDPGRRTLLWLYDIASAVFHYRGDMDWDGLIDRAQAYDLVLPVQQAVAAIGAEWAGLIPDPVARRIENLTASRGEWAFRNWANSSDRAQVRLMRANLASMTDWRARVGYVLGNVFPQIAYMQHRYAVRDPLPVLLSYPYRWLQSLYRVVCH